MAWRAPTCRYETQCVAGFAPPHSAFYRRDVFPRFGLLCALVALLIFPGVLAAQSDDLLRRVWEGVQQAQKKYTSSCGTISETRTSSLMVRPLVLRGKFCAEGTTRFSLDYFEPSSMRIRFNENYLNVTSGGKTEVMEIGKSVRRAESYFGRDNSLGNLKKNFTIIVQEDSRDYQMKLVPRTDTFRRRLNYMVIKLDKRDFFPRALEVDGKSGVNSVFVIDVTSMNPKIPPDMFEVYKP
ncbi:MAG: outer membrane lipoprotein carrier protein LolA [Candidatus Sulfotelmatobacter sp.]